MPKILTNGVNIYYEAYGDGTPTVYLQSPLGGINPGAYYFAGRMSAYSQTIIWDSPSIPVLIVPAADEFHRRETTLQGSLPPPRSRHVQARHRNSHRTFH